MRQIAADPNVEYVEVDKLNKPLLTPNDTRYSEQWGYSGTYGIKANQAWDVTNGSGVVVAVLDTGITNHSDLNANILPGYDFISDTAVSNDGNGRDSDASDPGDWVTANQCGGTHAAQNSSWHGTHVAGTIAAVTNNAKGVAGVAYGAKIVPARVLGTCGGYDSDIADAITWASGGTVSGVPANANPAEVINLSLGGSRRLRHHHAERDQRRRRPRHHAGHRRRQRQRQRVERLAGQLQQRHRRRLDHQHRCAFELLQLRHADRHRRARARTSCRRSTPAPPRRAPRPTPRTTAPRWRPRTSPASSR